MNAGLISRGAFVLIAAFWAAMNVLLWRAEYGSRDRGTPVPLDLVCRKILTAPDASTMSVYQGGQRMGFCELATGVEQQMAEFSGDSPPPAGLVARAGYQLRLTGNVAFGAFTNRVKFDGRVEFSPDRQWRELNLKITTHFATVEIHARATNQTVSVQITNEGVTESHLFTFADLENPRSLLRAFGGGAGDGFGSGLDLPFLPSGTADLARNISWDARRVRFTMNREETSAYRLETSVLGQPIVVYANTLGEILRVELPGGVTATLDEWSR